MEKEERDGGKEEGEREKEEGEQEMGEVGVRAVCGVESGVTRRGVVLINWCGYARNSDVLRIGCGLCCCGA